MIWTFELETSGSDIMGWSSLGPSWKKSAELFFLSFNHFIFQQNLLSCRRLHTSPEKKFDSVSSLDDDHDDDDDDDDDDDEDYNDDDDNDNNDDDETMESSLTLIIDQFEWIIYSLEFWMINYSKASF